MPTHTLQDFEYVATDDIYLGDIFAYAKGDMIHRDVVEAHSLQDRVELRDGYEADDAPEPDDAPDDPDAPDPDEVVKPPAKSASKADWVAYAVAHCDIPAEQAEASTRDELAAAFGE